MSLSNVKRTVGTAQIDDYDIITPSEGIQTARQVVRFVKRQQEDGNFHPGIGRGR